MKTLRFNKELLNFCLKRDKAKLNDKSKVDILNRDSNIIFTCNCGEEGEKKFRTAMYFGGFYCVNCTNFNRIKKIHIANTQKNNNKKLLEELITKQNIKIHSITVNTVAIDTPLATLDPSDLGASSMRLAPNRTIDAPSGSETKFPNRKEEEIKIENNNIKSIKKIIKSDIIKGECRECNYEFEKSLKYLIKNGPICYKCSRLERFEK
jgi:hypothetical protein